MLRKIVVFRNVGALGAMPKASAQAAREPIQRELGGVKGLELVGSIVASPAAVNHGPVPALALPSNDAFFAPVAGADEDAFERLGRDRADQIAGIFADVPIGPAAPYCAEAPVGRDTDVTRRLKLGRLADAGLTGRGVRIALVDSGIDRRGAPKADKPIKRIGDHCWHPSDPSYRGGKGPLGHGTMCAYDAQLVAPDAEILDYALLHPGHKVGTLEGWLFDALAACADILDQHQAQAGRPMVVSNSWALYNRKGDAPEGSPQNYSANPLHPFNQMIRRMVEEGIDVLFAAGNCGRECPSANCGAGDKGPGASILGANGHPDVITVAAVTVQGDRLGYSSQGPATLATAKPDVAAYSHFAGSGVFPADNGTSAACPIAAGVVAALRTKAKKVPPATIKAALQRTAKDLGGKGFDGDTGFGLIHPLAAARALGLKVR